MPLFEYRCSACGKLEEVLQKLSDPAPGQCPSCGAAETMSKELSLSAFHLKGGGWYKDLYASSKGAAEPVKADTKADTKPTADAPATTTAATPAPAPATPAPAAAPSSGTGGTSTV
jgi:putative FmdB family regulatory protein